MTQPELSDYAIGHRGALVANDTFIRPADSLDAPWESLPHIVSSQEFFFGTAHFVVYGPLRLELIDPPEHLGHA